jgi:hypothetical protein
MHYRVAAVTLAAGPFASTDPVPTSQLYSSIYDVTSDTRTAVHRSKSPTCADGFLCEGSDNLRTDVHGRLQENQCANVIGPAHANQY